MAKKKKTPPPITSLDNSRGYSGRLHAGTFSGATRDATSLFGNAVFAETLKGLQENAESRSNDYKILRQQAANEQGGFEKFGTALVSGVSKGLVNGVNGIVSLVPYPDDVSAEGLQNWNWDIMSDDFSDRSMLSNYLDEGSKAIGLQMPIYDENPYNFYAGMDAGLTSIGEFAIPGKIISKGVGLAAKTVGRALRGVGRGVRGATSLGRMSTRSRLAKFGARTDDFLTRMSMSPKNQAFLQTGASGFAMNRFEGTVMGHQVYEETMQELAPAVAAGQLTEEEAQSYANQAALSVRNKNAGMMMTDMFAMYGIFKAKGMTRNLLTKPGFTSAVKNNLLSAKAWNPLKKAAATNPFYQALVEGGEEIIQSNIQKQSQYDALKGAEALAASRVGKEEELVYVPDSDSYYERLKDNLFSKDAAFEGAIGFFSGPIQSVALEQGMGIKPLLDNRKYKNYTKEINALQQSIKPGGSVTGLAKKLKVQEQIEDLKLKRAQETSKGAYEEQQRVIGEVKADVKNALKETVNMEDLIEEVQEKGVEGVEELLEGTAFVNTAVKHFQNGTTENLERMLKDLAEGKGDPATFGENTQQKAADLLTEMLEMEKQWLRYHDFENKASIFAAIQNEKEIDKAINRTQSQKENAQAKILTQLNEYAPSNNYGFDENGNLTITPKSEEEKKLDDDLPGQQTSLFPTNDEVRAFYERMPEKKELDEVNQTQNTFREVKGEVSKFLNNIASGKGQRAAKKLRKQREKAARRAAKRIMATNKVEAGEKTKAKTNSEKSAISNAQAKVNSDSKIVVKKVKPKAPTAPPPPTSAEKKSKEEKEIEKGKAAETNRRTTAKNGEPLKSVFAKAIAKAAAKSKEKEPVNDDSASEGENFTKSTENKSSHIQGRTDGVTNDSENAFWTLSDPSLTAEGDVITFQVEDQNIGAANDPTSPTRGLKVIDVKGRKKEIAKHENSTYGSNISEDQAADDAEAIAIYNERGDRIGYVGSPLAISSKRRNMTTEEMLEEKENLRTIRAQILSKTRNGEAAKGKINSITKQYTNFKEEGSPDSRSIDVFGTDVIIGVATAEGVTFEGGSNNLTQAAGSKIEAKMEDSERLDDLTPGLPYAFVPVRKDNKGVIYYEAFPLLPQDLNAGFINTVIYALKSWAGGIDANIDKQNRDEASATLGLNLKKNTKLRSLSMLLERFFLPRTEHPYVADDETRTYIYLNQSNSENEVIELVENVGGQQFVRGTIRRGEQLTEDTIATLEQFLANEQVQIDLRNIDGIPYIITDRDGNVKESIELADFKTHVLKNTTTGLNPVESVLNATGRTIFYKSPKVTFSVESDRSLDTSAPENEQEEEKPPWDTSKESDLTIEQISKLPFVERIPALIKAGIIASDVTYNVGKRFPIIVNIGGVKVGFYRSSEGTGGKKKGAWTPMFGYGEDGGNPWLIKGNIATQVNVNYGSSAIQEYADILNKTLNWDLSIDKGQVKDHPFYKELRLVESTQAFNKELYGVENLGIINGETDVSGFINSKVQEINAATGKPSYDEADQVDPDILSDLETDDDLPSSSEDSFIRGIEKEEYTEEERNELEDIISRYVKDPEDGYDAVIYFTQGTTPPGRGIEDFLSVEANLNRDPLYKKWQEKHTERIKKESTRDTAPDVDDLVGDAVPPEVKEEHNKRHIKGLTPTQNFEIVGHLANTMFRKLVELTTDQRVKKVSRNKLYQEALEETMASFDKYIARLEKNLARKQAQENEALKNKMEARIAGLKKYKQAVENEAAKTKELATQKLNQFEGVKGQRSEEDLENIEETAHERRNFSEDFFLTVDSKKSTSKALRKFLSSIPLIKTKTQTIKKGDDNITVSSKAMPARTTFGAPKYADFDSVYNKLHSLEVGSDANLSNQLTKLAQLYVDYPGMKQELNWLPGLIVSLGIDNLQGTKKNNRGEEKTLADVFLEEALGPDDADLSNLVKLMASTDFGVPAGEKIQRQFAINMSKAKVKAPLVLYRAVQKGGKIKFEVNLTDHNNTDNSKQIINEMQEGFLNKLYTYNPETEEYEPDETAFERAIQLLESYKKTPPTQKNSDNYKDLRKQLQEVLGISISTQTFHTLATKGYRLGRRKVLLNRKNKNVFSIDGAPFRVLLDALKSSKGKPFNPEVNVFTDNAIKNLAQMESLSQTATLSNAFRVGDKTIYTYTEHNYATSQIQTILTDPKYREQLQNTVFAGESLWLHMMSPMGGQVLEIDGDVDAGSSIELGILNFRPVKERKESNLTTDDLDGQNMDDNLFTRLALFTANASASRKSIVKKDENNKNIYSFKSRKSTTVPLAYSDKHSVLTVTTAMPVFTIGKGDGVTSDTINIFYEHVLMAEISRIQNMFDIDGTNDAAYDAGKSAFHLMPEMNTTTVKDRGGETDTVANYAARGAFDPTSVNYDEKVVGATKRALGDQLNVLINEQIEDFAKAGINQVAGKSEATFVSSEYIKMLKAQHKNAGVKLEGNKITKAVAADYVLNHMLSTANMFQMFVKDPALYTKTDGEGNVDAASTLENIQKRLAAVIAPGTATAIEEGNDAYVQLFANDVKYSEFLGEGIKEYFKGIKNKKHRESYKGAEITDGQELITYQEYLGTMVSQGQITKAERAQIEAVVKDPNKKIPEWMMDVLFGAEKPVAVADKFVTLKDGQRIEKRVYVKSSGLPLIPKFTKGTELENLRKALEQIQEKSGLPVRLAFSSAVKVGLPETAKNTNIQYTEKDIESLKEELPEGLSAERRNEEEEKLDALLGTIKPVKELVSMFNGDLTEKELNSDEAFLEDESLRPPRQILQRKYWRIQQATPNKNKDIATRGTQESKIILSEVKEAFGEEAGTKLIEDWNSLHSKLFGLRIHELEREILNPDGSIDRKALAEFLDRDANEGGVSVNTRYGLEVDQNGKFVIPLDLSAGTLEYQTLINAIANKRIAQKKVKGQSTVLMTEFGFSIREGQDLSDSGIVWTQGFDFQHGKLKPARVENGVVKPAQVIVPNKFFVNGKRVNLKKYIIKGEQGQMILDTNRMPAEILKGFGFRIPTQGYNSMAGIEIVGFLPESMGDVVVAPGSFVNQMGSDFDIDKMFNYFYKLERSTISRRAVTDATIAISDEIAAIESGKSSLEDFKKRGDSEENYQAYLEDINDQIKSLEEELQNLKSKSTTFVKVTADDLKDKPFNELTEKEIARLEDALLNEGLDMRLKIMGKNEIYQTMSAPLDFGLLKYKDEEGNDTGLKFYFKDKRMSTRASSRNPLAPGYHTQKYQDARGAGAGVGVFARGITFQSMAQSGVDVIPGADFKLGRFKSNNITDSKTVTNNKRSKIEVLTAFLSASLDNEKEQIMNYLNINDDTFSTATAMIHSGFEEDLVLAFLESPVLRLLAENKRSRTKKTQIASFSIFNRLVLDLVPKDYKNLTEKEKEEEREKIIDEARKELAGSSFETKEETFNRLIQNSDVTLKYTPPKIGVSSAKIQFLNEEGKPLEKDELKRAKLLAIGSLDLTGQFKDISTDILAAQRLLNVDSGGLGKNAYEAYSKLEDYIGLADLQFGISFPHPIFKALIGEHRTLVYPAKMEGQEEVNAEELAEYLTNETELINQGFIRIAKAPGNTDVYFLKPVSTPATIFAESMGLTSRIYEDTMPVLVDYVLNNVDLSYPAIPKSLRNQFRADKKAKIVHDTLRSILFSSTENWISGQFEEATGLSTQPTQQTSDTINIYAGTNENAELSNFANRPVMDPLGAEFKNVEAAFQYAKTNFADGDNESIKMKLQNATGAQAKALGRKIKGLDVKAWDENSAAIMKGLIKDSFEQNPKALEKLLATGNATLTHTQDKTKYRELFPKLLMEVRQELGGSQSTASSLVQIRRALMYGDNTLALRVKEAIKDRRLSKNPFLKSLVLSTKAGERHKVTFANFTPDGMMDEDKADAFAQLFLMPDQSPIEGLKLTPAQLGALLVTYSMVTGGNQKALEFVRFVPNSYLVGTGFYKAINDKLTETLSTRSGKTNLSMSIMSQLVQHNPTLTYRKKRTQTIKKIEGSDNFTISGLKVEGSKSLGTLRAVDKSQRVPETVPFLHTISKKGNISLYYFDEDLNTPGNKAIYTKIDVLGDGGDLNEFSAGLINAQSQNAFGISVVPSNKKAYVEESLQQEETSEPDAKGKIDLESLIQKVVNKTVEKVIKVNTEPGVKVSRKLELNSNGESDPIKTIEAVATGSDSPMFRQLAAAFLTRKDDLKNITFKTKALKDGKDAGGSYTYDSKTIELSYSNDKLYNEYAILHEFGHALTKDAIVAFEKGGTYPNAKVKQAMKNIAEVQNLYVQYLEALNPVELEAFKKKYDEYRRRKGLSGKDRAKLPPLDFSNKKELGKYYGGLKLSEFVTMVLSDEVLQAELDKVMPTLEGAAAASEKSLFRELLDAIKEILEGLTGVSLSKYTVEQAMTIVTQGMDTKVQGNPGSTASTDTTNDSAKEFAKKFAPKINLKIKGDKNKDLLPGSEASNVFDSNPKLANQVYGALGLTVVNESSTNIASTIYELIPDITESKIDEIYNNYVSLIGKARKDKEISKDAFKKLLRKYQVFNYKDTYIFGQYDMDNGLFVTRINSSPTSKELLAEALPTLVKQGIDFASFVPKDVAQKYKRSGYSLSKEGFAYNFKGEDMVKYLAVSNPNISLKVFGKTLEEISAKEIKDFSKDQTLSYKPVEIKGELIEKAGNDLSKILETYLNQFGIVVKDVSTIKNALNIDELGFADILSKVAYVENNKDLPPIAGEFIAYMMQYNPLVSEIIKELSQTENYKKLDKSEYFKIVGGLISDDLQNKLDENYSQSLLQKLKQLIQEFFSLLRGTRIDLINKNVGIISNNILQQNKKLITASLYKPGAYGKPTKQVSLKEAMASDKFGSSIINKLAKEGFILTGSTSLGEQGTIQRPDENLLHDIDWVSPFNREKTAEKFLKQYPDAIKIRDIQGDSFVTDTWIISPEGYSIKNLNKQSDYNIITSYDVVDNKGNIAGTYRLEKKAKQKRKEEVVSGVEAKVIDFFSYDDFNQLTPFVKDNVELANWKEIFKAKLQFGRYKDIWDFNRFIPNENLSEITPQQKQIAQQRYSDYVAQTGKQDIEGFKDFVREPAQQRDSLPTSNTVDLGVDIVDFLKQLSPEERKFYNKLFQEGQFTVKCRK